MDYPKSVPNVGLVNGKFVDENTTTGQVGSLIPATWGNGVTDELLNVIRAGGKQPAESENDQLLAAIKAIVRDSIPEEKVRDTLAAYGINDAYTKTQVDDALANKAEKATTLAGYGIKNAYTKSELDAETGKFDKVGGRISGITTISTALQTEARAGLIVENPDASADWSGMVLSGGYGSVSLRARMSLNTIYLRNHVNAVAHLDAGNITSNGSRVLVAPTADTFRTIAGATTLPAGGTWIYSFTSYNGGGAAIGGGTGVVAGGQTIGGGNTIGWAWRIQ
ncbi:hypothetical protein [Pseudomonas protegens]|uniref:hypothetical protein n=1 Tax=Pseudomonas protegens TaxID=380021 RepID=UPI002776D154|nr:hypothetical protein [Pseudomonas protegens]MDP9524718.1 hypothetical protein [Pseudomonas protegens]